MISCIRLKMWSLLLQYLMLISANFPTNDFIMNKIKKLVKNELKWTHFVELEAKNHKTPIFRVCIKLPWYFLNARMLCVILCNFITTRDNIFHSTIFSSLQLFFPLMLLSFCVLGKAFVFYIMHILYVYVLWLQVTGYFIKIACMHGKKFVSIRREIKK